MEKAIIVDLDGTLTNVDHRLHYLEQEPKDRNAFYNALGGDSLNLWCSNIMNAMAKDGYKTILITGRREAHRDKTEVWLAEHNIEYLALYMRPNRAPDGVTDKSYPDHVFKKDIYQREIENKYDVLFVLEDRLSVVKMWREIGLVCLQCNWGDF